MPETYRDTDNAIKALGDCLAFNSRDWAKDKADAWLWGIINGWDDEDPGDSAMDELAGRHGWDEHDIARLRRLHQHFTRLGGLEELAREHAADAHRLRQEHNRRDAELLDALTTAEHAMTTQAGLPTCSCGLSLAGGKATDAWITHRLEDVKARL